MQSFLVTSITYDDKLEFTEILLAFNQAELAKCEEQRFDALESVSQTHYKLP